MARLSEKRVLEKINEAKGNLAAVARAFGVSRQAVHQFVQEYPALVSATENAREEMLDNAESKLYMEALGTPCNTTALIFFLKTQGKRRGYVERMESTGPDGGPMVVNNVSLTDEERLDRAVALLDKARARRVGQAALEAADPQA